MGGSAPAPLIEGAPPGCGCALSASAPSLLLPSIRPSVVDGARFSPPSFPTAPGRSATAAVASVGGQAHHAE
eukprot:3177001-Rhodomonas_salina.1